jgi:intraflagellar transport protein 80
MEVTLDEDNKISVVDCLNELNEELDYNERVVNMSLKYGQLIVCTTAQCFVYSFSAQNWTSPFVFDVKDSIYMIV